MSAFLVRAARSGVNLLAEMTVASARMRRMATGLPTMLLAPTQTQVEPGRGTPVDSIISMTARAVQGMRERRP